MHIWTELYWKSFIVGIIWVPADEYCSQWFCEVCIGPLAFVFSNKDKGY